MPATVLLAIRPPVLADHVWYGRGLARAAALVAGGSIVLVLSAKIEVPF